MGPRQMSSEQPRVFDFYPLEDRILLSGEGMDGAETAPDADIVAAMLAEVGDADAQAPDQEFAAAVNSFDIDALNAQQDVADVPNFDPASHWKWSSSMPRSTMPKRSWMDCEMTVTARLNGWSLNLRPIKTVSSRSARHSPNFQASTPFTSLVMETARDCN